MSQFKHWRLRNKIIIPAVAMAVVASAGLGYVIRKQQQEIAVEQALATGASIAKQVKADREVYTKRVVGKLRTDKVEFTAHDSKHLENPGHIPLPATFVHLTSAIVNKDANGHKVDLLSKWNINPEKGARTPFESHALDEVARDPSKPIWKVEGEGDTARLTVVTADVASAQTCVDCHNNPAPAGWRKSTRTNFKLNDVMGGLVVSMPLAKSFNDAQSNAIKLTVTLIAVIAVMLFLIAMIQQKFVSQPLVHLEQAADRISTGELEQPIQVTAEDEVGQLGKAFERMRVSLAAAMKAIEDKR